MAAANLDEMSKLIVEGLWYNPGQEPKRMAVFENGVVFNFQPGCDQICHGFQACVTFRDGEDSEGHMMCLGFHHKNENCAGLKMKKLIARGGNVWRDEFHREMFVAFKIHPNAGVPSNIAKWCSPIAKDEGFARIFFGDDDALSSLDQVKLLLRWFQPNSDISYLALDKSMQVSFISLNRKRSVPHGTWLYDEDDSGNTWLATHFQWQGSSDTEGIPLCPPTLFQGVNKSMLAFDAEAPSFFFAVGTKVGDGAGFPEKFAVLDSMRDHRSWHIVAQVIWSCR
jgi:hypothetical protein